MVQAGQYLERMTVVMVEGGFGLDGLYHRGEASPPVLVAPSHPRFGGSMDHPVVAETAWAVTRAGHATLRINWRGVGASGGDWEEGRWDLTDLAAAARHLEDSSPAGPAGLVGHGHGAAVCLELARDRPVVRQVALIAPALGERFTQAVAEVAERPGRPLSLLVLVGAEDPHCPRDALQTALAPVMGTAPVRLVPSADHQFLRGLPEVGRQIADFFGA